MSRNDFSIKHSINILNFPPTSKCHCNDDYDIDNSDVHRKQLQRVRQPLSLADAARTPQGGVRALERRGRRERPAHLLSARPWRNGRRRLHRHRFHHERRGERGPRAIAVNSKGRPISRSGEEDDKSKPHLANNKVQSAEVVNYKVGAMSCGTKPNFKLPASSW